MSLIDFQNNATTWDLDTNNGDLILVYDADCVEQFLKQRLWTFRGEWFLDLTAGVPYYQDVLVKNPNPILVDAVLKEAILGTEGVIELTAFSLDYEPSTRTLSVLFTVRSVNGPITINESLGQAGG